MWNDPIVEEVRQVREKHAERFDFDLKEIFKDIRRQEEISGREYVTKPPKLVRKESA